jgi:hypothetical protein
MTESLEAVVLAKSREGALGLVLEAGLVAPQYHESGDEGDRDDGQDGVLACPATRCTSLPKVKPAKCSPK